METPPPVAPPLPVVEYTMPSGPYAIRPSDLLTVKQAAAWLGVCRRTIYNWIWTGKVECVRLPSGRKRIPVSALLRAKES